MALCSQAWVTFVTQEDNVAMKALVLVHSLQRVATKYPTVVFAPSTLNKEQSGKLIQAFDLFIPLTGLSHLKIEEEALVRALTLKMFEKCIFLSPHCMFLRNCDELHTTFDNFGFSNCDDKEHLPLLGFKTSLAQSDLLEECLLSIRKNGSGGLSLFPKLQKWTQTNFEIVNQFDEKYNVKLNLKEETECFIPDASIVTLKNEDLNDIISNVDNGTWITNGTIESQAAQTLRHILSQLESPIPEQHLPAPLPTFSGPREPIAVVGMSCRLPGANNIDEFWELLATGKSVVGPVPSFRWKRNQSIIPCKNRNVSAGFLDVPIDEFDCKFFGISPREAELLDPQQRLLHEVTWEALEDALINPLKLKGTRTGFFVGTWIYDYKEIALRVPDFDFYRAYMGNSVAATAARLSHFFETTGPSIGTESGCSSSIAAVHMACKSLQSRESNLAIACGANLIIHPFENSNLGFILASDGRCKTFDAKADGFARAEGCCAVVLKRLSDAVRDKDNIWGLVRGSAIVQEGPSRSMGTPTVQCESLAMELALKDARVHPKEVSLIEAHGTGTPVGDPMEMAAITNVYGGIKRNQPIYIGSVKTNIGHTEAVSGLAGLIKVILTMKHELIPAHLNFDTLNPEIDLNVIPAEIPLSTVPFPRKENPRICGVSSFGISGTDGHLIVQETPAASLANESSTTLLRLERPIHLLKLSAKCEESLEILLNKYEAVLQDDSIDFRDVAYTANVGRAEFKHRVAIIAKDSTEALLLMKDKKYKVMEISGSRGKKVCFLFTGQGSQYEGMAKQLYETSPIFQYYFRKCCRMLRSFGSVDLSEILLSSSSNPELINRTMHSQLSVFVVEYCLLKLWESWGMRPDYVIGHSLGEFVAAVAVGALDLKSALELVAIRSRLIDTLPEGKMIVVRTKPPIVLSMMNELRTSQSNFWVDIAAVNSTEQTVLAGDPENVTLFSKYCETKDIKAVVLASTHAFHSRLMDSMMEDYETAATAILGRVSSKIRKECVYISGVEGKIIDTSKLQDKTYWMKHCREKVNFHEACKTARKEEDCCIFLEIGPHPVLSALAMTNMEGKSILCLPSIRRGEENWITLLDTLGKLWVSEWDGTIDWKGFDRDYNRKRIASLPFYPFVRRSIWAEMQPHTDWPLAPLLGSVVCSPSNVVLFNNYITLKRFSYLKDHTILNQVVFPAAAFLEICLCAGHAAAQGYLNDFIKPNRAVGIKDLQILAPFGVLEVSASKVQTIVKLETEEGEKTAVVYKAEVHHWLPENGGEPERNKVELNGGKWVHHANASFIPMFPSETSTKIDIRGIQNGLESKEVSTQEIYEGVSELGLRFGPTFQSLKKGWIHVEHEHEYGILFELKLPDKREECMIHPVIGDAMLQATMIWRRKLTGEKTKRRLQVPVKIANFVWFPSEVVVDEELFIYCQSNENENTSTISTSLINQRGELLGRMSGIEFIETTAKLVVGMIQQQSVQLPRTWEETLIESPGPFQGNIPYKIWETAPRLPSNSHGWLDKGRPGEQEILAFNHISKLTVFQMLKALLDLGWSPKLNEKFTTSQIMLLLGIKDNFTRYIDFFLDQMAKENMISKESDQGYIVGPGLISNVLHLGDKLKEVVSTEETSRCDYRLISEIGKRLAEIFGGKVDPLGLVLFPEDHTKPTAEGIYDFYSPELIHVGQGVNNVLTKSFPAIKADSVSNYLRILEVGGGTGVSTRAILDCIVPALEEQELNMEYVFTDISSAFFTPAKKSLEKYLNYVTFHKLDIERDPFSQGFCPEYFDVIVCAEVLHATRDIRDAVKHLKQLIKPCGSIQITETVQDDPILMFIFGLLDGYWRFTDFDLRAKSPILSASKWRKVLEVAGFTDVTLFTTSQGIHSYIHAHRQPSHLESIAEQMCHHGWLIFYDDLTQHFVSALEQKMRQIGRVFMKIRRPMRTDIDMNSITVETDMKAWIRQQIKDASFKNSKIPLEGVVYLWGVIEKDEHDQKHISLPLVSILQEILTSNVGLPSKLLFVTYRNDNPSAATLLGIVKSFVIENSHLRSTTMCLDRDDELATQVNQVFTSLWGSKNAFEYNEFCDGKRFIKRLKTKKLTSNELQLPPNCDRFQLVVPSTRQIADLEFTHLEPYTIGDDDVEVRVKAVALNFRDIFSVLKPIPLFDDMNCIGLDFSGVVTQIGSHVRKVKPGDFVICPNFDKNLALPSHVKVSQSFVMHLPEEMTFCEGATIPAAFMTGFYCLYDLGRLKKDDTLLIHAASGGVGLAAIRLAKAVNANIVATAGSDRKRAYLRSIGIVHVFNSRTTEFSEKILELTMGRGVDIVLNSLTGPGFKEASLKALAQNGRFIEMSKVQVWSVEEVAEIRPDVEYHVADITSLSEDTLKSNLIRIKNGIERHAGYNAIESLPYERFDAPDIRSALHHVQQAKHIGKVVCIMPEIARESLKMKAFVPLFNDRSTYIVTGGLGGIGFEVVKWMLRNGAKHIIIVSRSTEPAPEQAELINIFNDKTGKNVRLFSLDVSDFNKCADLFGKIQKSGYGFPKIRGIMHVAGVLENATLENQTWAMFESTYKAKVHGSWNLHLLTKHLKLEHFVMFSSIASVWGAPGQANYSASNSFQDALVHFRNSQGLPGITINWGNWGEVGIATEVDFPGVRPISTSQGLLLLGTILRAPKATQLMAANVDSFSLLSQCIPYIKQFIDETALFGETTAHAVNISSDEFWAELDAAPDRESKLNVFKNNIKRFVRSLLRIDVNENIGDTVDFQSLGIDSLMMLEMKNSLQNILGSRLIITASQVRDCNNVNLLANRLLDMIDSKEEESLIPTLEELRHLIHEDLYLVNESFLEPMKALKSEADIESLFITGVTGSLGSYILKDILSKVKSIQKIYCLVRRRGDVTGAKRLQEIMNKRGIICPTYVNIEVVEGDVGKDNLGLNHELYEELAADVDAVIHYAAKSDHIAKYWKAASSRCLDSIRNINVLGTKRVLEFASHVKTKHVFYASSLSTTTTVNEDAGTLSENWQEDNAFDTLSYNNGYLISKFISEQLVKKAWSRGLPCKSLRFGLVAGDGKTGELDILSSHYMIRLLAFLKLRCMSDIPMPSPLITPNACSEALVRICFNEKVPRGVYNVIPPHPQLEQVFVTVAEEIGVQVELVSLSDFLQKLRMERDDSPIAPLKRIYTEDGTALVEIARNISSIQKWMDDSTPDFFVSKKLTEFLPGFLDVMEPTIDIMRRDIGFAKKSGAFEMIGI